MSGGRNKGKELSVDDQLIVYRNDQSVFNSGPTSSQFNPVTFRVSRGDRIKIYAYDNYAPYYHVSPLYLHCVEGGEGRKKLSDYIEGERTWSSYPHVFLSVKYTIGT